MFPVCVSVRPFVCLFFTFSLNAFYIQHLARLIFYFPLNFFALHCIPLFSVDLSRCSKPRSSRNLLLFSASVPSIAVCSLASNMQKTNRLIREDRPTIYCKTIFSVACLLFFSTPSFQRSPPWNAPFFSSLILAYSPPCDAFFSSQFFHCVPLTQYSPVSSFLVILHSTPCVPSLAFQRVSPSPSVRLNCNVPLPLSFSCHSLHTRLYSLFCKVNCQQVCTDRRLPKLAVEKGW